MKPYQNPIIPNSPTATTWDPYVLRYGGYYYHCYSNKQGVFISRSETLWGIGEGEATMVYDCTVPGALTDWFAPELHRIGDKWYIYASPDYGDFLHVMTVLEGEGDTPICAYENRGMVRGIENKWNLDGTVLWHNDRLYFVWSDCAHMYIAAMADPLTVSEPISVLTTPELPFETRVGCVTEGPAVLYRNDLIHIVYSANDSRYDDYCLGLLTFSGGDILDPANWRKSPEAIFAQTKDIHGPGHCSFTTVTEGGLEVDYIVYHANRIAGSGWSGREVFIQPITWDENGYPVLGKPTF